MPRKVALIVAFVVICASSNAFADRAGDVVSVIEVGVMSATQIEAVKEAAGITALPAAKNGVRSFKVIYRSPDLQGRLTNVSGLLMIPDGGADEDRSVVSYQHGTAVEKTDVPSNPDGSDLLACAIFYGSAGYVVTAADYLGLGESPGLHPYLDARTEATVSVDLVRAARTLAGHLPFRLDNRLFISGYSQGGHATMALHKYIEEEIPLEFDLVASSPMSGPYDLSDTTMKSALNRPSPSSTVYTAYLLQAMNLVHGGLYARIGDAVRAPYDEKLVGLFDGTHSFSEIAVALPRTPSELLQPEYLDAIRNHPDHPFNRALRANDVYDWKPLAPVRLYGGRADLDVPFANAEKTVKRMGELGADVQAFNLDDSFDHRTAAFPSFTQSSLWFDSVGRWVAIAFPHSSTGLYPLFERFFPAYPDAAATRR